MSTAPRQKGQPVSLGRVQDEILQLNLDMKNLKYKDKYAKYHGDKLIGVSPAALRRPTLLTLWLTLSQDKVAPTGFLANLENSADDFRRILTFKNLPAI